MGETDFEKMVYAAVIAGLGAITAWFSKRGNAKSDGTPPEERAPTVHEIKRVMDILLVEVRRMDEANGHKYADLVHKFDSVGRKLDHIAEELDDAKNERRIEEAFNRRRDRT